MIKKRAKEILEARKKEATKKNWYESKNEYEVWLELDKKQCIYADGYIISHDKCEPSYLTFYIRLGDELVEVARFMKWISVKLNLETLYKRTNP